MKRTTRVLMVAALALLAGNGAVSGEIYTWIDDDGNVHYEDRPTDEMAAAMLDIESRDTDNAAVYEQTQARLDAKAAAEQVESEAPAPMSKKDLRAEKEKRQQQCQKYRDQLDQFVRARALYNEGANGERVYQDESQRQATVSRVEGQIREYCGS